MQALPDRASPVLPPGFMRCRPFRKAGKASFLIWDDRFPAEGNRLVFREPAKRLR
jgi:hypothetical protein